MAETRDDSVYKAKLAEQAERYDGKNLLTVVFFIFEVFKFYFFYRNGECNEKCCHGRW